MKKGDLFPIASYADLTRCDSIWQGHTTNRSEFQVEHTGEFRKPQAGEWFISGAIPEGYYTANNLLSQFHIGRLVRIKRETIISVIERF